MFPWSSLDSFWPKGQGDFILLQNTLKHPVSLESNVVHFGLTALQLLLAEFGNGNKRRSLGLDGLFSSMKIAQYMCTLLLAIMKISQAS